MSYLIPDWELSEVKKQYFRTSCKMAMVQQAAISGIGSDLDQLKIEGLLPHHFGMEYWGANFPASSQLIDWIRHKCPEGKVIGITKVIQLSVAPSADGIIFNPGTSRAFSLLPLYSGLAMVQAMGLALDHSAVRPEAALLSAETFLRNIAVGWFTEPIVYSPLEPISIDLACRKGGGFDLILLDGFVGRKA